MAQVKLDKVGFENYVMQLTMDIAKEAAFDLQEEIQESMRTSPEWTERTYYRKGGRKHHPSYPGNPPRVDYGRLHDSISVNWYNSGMTRGKVGNRAPSSDGVKQPTKPGDVVIGTATPYWDNVEYGNRKGNRMKARPYLTKPAERMRKVVSKAIRNATTKRALTSIAKLFTK